MMHPFLLVWIAGKKFCGWLRHPQNFLRGWLAGLRPALNGYFFPIKMLNYS